MSEPKSKYEARRPVPFCPINPDHAFYLGNDENGVYFDVAYGPGGWYFSALVWCEHFSEAMYTDDGPYMTQDAAFKMARTVAREWCEVNDVPLDDDTE
jgi:hypothetical protein